MFNVMFLRAAAERAISTFAQTLGALLIAAGTNLIDTDWKGLLSASGMAALLSILKSFGAGALSGGNPSLGGGEVVADSPSD